MFNHFDPASPLWRELGDPALLRTLPKTYFASVQGASNSRSYYPAGAHFKLPKLTPDAPERLPAGAERSYGLELGDDLRNVQTLRARLVLRVEAVTGKPPRVEWDGALVTLRARDERHWSGAVDSASITPGLHRATITAIEPCRLDDLWVQIE
jgi:hypothetical protein